MNRPVQSSILVVEGWLPYSFLQYAVNEFTENSYETMILLGGNKKCKMLLSNHSISGEENSTTEIQEGKKSQQLIIIPVESGAVHKTYSAYRALNNWIKNSDERIHAINIFTASVHARKSYILCRRVLDTDISVGVISSAPQYYNPKYWWLSKRGIYLVSRNTIGLLYALLWWF